MSAMFLVQIYKILIVIYNLDKSKTLKLFNLKYTRLCFLSIIKSFKC